MRLRRVETRRVELAALKRDGRLTMCPYACGYRGRADTLDNHTRFHCRRRPVKCTKCPVIVTEEVLVEVCAGLHAVQGSAMTARLGVRVCRAGQGSLACVCMDVGVCMRVWVKRRGSCPSPPPYPFPRALCALACLSSLTWPAPHGARVLQAPGQLRQPGPGLRGGRSLRRARGPHDAFVCQAHCAVSTGVRPGVSVRRTQQARGLCRGGGGWGWHSPRIDSAAGCRSLPGCTFRPPRGAVKRVGPALPTHPPHPTNRVCTPLLCRPADHQVRNAAC